MHLAGNQESRVGQFKLVLQTGATKTGVEVVRKARRCEAVSFLEEPLAQKPLPRSRFEQ